jgi:hypothetical protein
MPDDENVIEEDVVKIYPDLSGFRRRLERDLKKEMFGAGVEVPVKLVEEQAGRNFVANLRAKYERENARALKRAAEQAHDAQIQAARDLVHRADLERNGAKATAKAEADRRKAVEDTAKAQRDAGVDAAKNLMRQSDLSRKAADAERARAEELKKTNFGIKRAVEERQRAELAANVKQQRKDEEFRNFQERINSELSKIDRDRADDEIRIREETLQQHRRIERAAAGLRTSVLAAVDKAERAETDVVRRENGKRTDARRKSLTDSLSGQMKKNPVIDFGGRGIRPMNLLYGTVIALSPALLALSSTALQASTSVAALGSAGIGAALGLGGVLTAFQGLGDVLALRKQVQNEALTAGANGAKSAAGLAAKADRISDALGSYRSAMREEKDAAAEVHKARVEAARDLENLRQKVVSLNNEYSNNKLSLREAQENERATNLNFFATATERLRARQDTMDAKTRLGETRLERRQTQQDLRESIKKGVANADKVVNAQDSYIDAKRRRQRAGHALQNARSGADAAAVGATSSAAAQLEQKLKDMAPAARDIYYWFVRNEGVLKRLQRGIAQDVLPGFHTFLEEISKPVRGRTTMQVFADAMGEMGAIAGKYTGLLGTFMQSPLFRDSFARIQQNNAAAFDRLGSAGLKFLEPLMRILDKASPLFLKMALALESLSYRFANFIEKSDRDGSLAKWFEDAYESGRKWMKVGGNILKLLGNIFKLSLPSGTGLLDKLVEFTGSLAEWSASSKGQKQITRFFEFFRDLPYGQIRDFFVQAGELFLMIHAGKWATSSPLHLILTALGALAAAHPAGATQLLAGITSTAQKVIGIMAANPEATSLLLGLLAAHKLKKTLGISLAIPGLAKLKDTLTSKFKILDKFLGGGAKTATMTVHAGVVNVYGKALGGAPGAAPGGAKPGKLTNSGAVVGGVTLAAALGAFFGGAGYDSGLAGQGIIDQFAPFIKNPTPENALKALGPASPLWWAGYGWGKGNMPEPPKPAAPFGYGIDAKAKEESAKKRRAVEDIAKLHQEQGRLNIPGGKQTTASLAKNPRYLEYAAARKEEIAKTARIIELNEGEAAAKRHIQQENRNTVNVLRNLMIQSGLSADEAENLAYQMAGVDQKTEKAAEKVSNWTSRVIDAAREARAAAIDIQDLGWGIDKATGEKVLTLRVNGEDQVFKSLEKAVAYQWVLRTGKEPTEAALKRQQQVMDKAGRPGAMADGGRVPGFSPNSRADNIPAMLTANEYVQPVDVVRHYGVGFMDALRRKEIPKYAKGGPVNAWPFPVAWPKGMDTVVTPPSSGPGAEQEYTGRVPRGLGAVANLTSRMMAAVIDAHNTFPWATVYSGRRYGRAAITVTGKKSYHGFGRATDWPASMELFDYFRDKYGDIAKEIIYSPAGNRQIRNGNPFYYTGKVRDTHFNHVHLALAQGGLVPRKYDTGGVLPPGFSLAFNGTGKNETVRTSEQERSLSGPIRLDRRDIALLAASLSGSTPNINMDGRKVAEVTNRYAYLPAGV